MEFRAGAGTSGESKQEFACFSWREEESQNLNLPNILGPGLEPNCNVVVILFIYILFLSIIFIRMCCPKLKSWVCCYTLLTHF